MNALNMAHAIPNQQNEVNDLYKNIDNISV